MGYRDYYQGLYRDHYRDPFPHSLLSTRELCKHQPIVKYPREEALTKRAPSPQNVPTQNGERRSSTKYSCPFQGMM